MFDWELGETLARTGKKRFVVHFDLFRNYANGVATREEAIAGVQPAKDASVSLGQAKKIFDARREADALWIIYQSDGVDQDTRDRAKDIRDDLT